MDIKKYQDYILKESFTIPNIKLEEFLHNIPGANKSHKISIAAFYTTFEAYIDEIDKNSHKFRVNDMKGDIMGNNRVVINVVCFSDVELDNIRNNVVNFSMNEFYSEIPNTLDIFGLQIKPLSYINKEQVKQLFDTSITKEMTTRIITDCTKYNYEGIKNNYHIWSQK